VLDENCPYSLPKATKTSCFALDIDAAGVKYSTDIRLTQRKLFNRRNGCTIGFSVFKKKLDQQFGIKAK